MAGQPEIKNMALFCDFENIALGVRDAKYAQYGNTAALLSSLRAVGRVLGVSRLAASAGLSRKGFQKALSEEGNQYFESVNAIIHAMGYYLVPQKLTDTPRP